MLYFYCGSQPFTMIYLVLEKLIAIPYEPDLRALRRMVRLACLAVEKEIVVFSVREQAELPAVELLQELWHDFREVGDPELFFHLKSRAIDILEKLLTWMLDKKLAAKGQAAIPVNLDEVRRIQALDEIEFALLEIEENNRPYFRSRQSYKNWQLPDRIFDHVWFFTGSNTVMLHIHSTSDLHDDIKDQILTAFEDIQRRYSD